MMQTSKGTNRSVFQPTFGNRPDQYIGRDGVIEQFMAAMREVASAYQELVGDMEDNVFKPILSPLSDNDKIFLKAMARQGGVVSIANLQAALGKKGPAIQPYRKRLLEAGVIEAPRRGELVFAVPYLADYLINQ